MGDPTGIGPEILVGALREPSLYEICRPIVLGRPAILKRACQLLNQPIEVREVTDIDSIDASTDQMICLTCGSHECEVAPHGKPDARGGQAAHDCLVAATQLALRKQVDAIVTAPLHKGALHAAGHHWPGHTELLAHLCGVPEFAMMLYLPPRLPSQRALDNDSPKDDLPNGGLEKNRMRGGPVGLGVVHVTLHVAMREIFDLITPANVLEKITLAHDVFFRLRKSLNLPPSPALAVAALNPHGGEGGLFGNEESESIAPAVRSAQALGWNVTGPWPVDTLMPTAAQGKYDAVVAMYHDQGHIALKLLDMFDAVNITLGLPIWRTSVAHGTAHDQAWQGTASCTGMIQAIRTAAWLAGSAPGTMK